MNVIKVRPTGYGVAADVSERDVGSLHSPPYFSLLVVKRQSRLHWLGFVDVMPEFRRKKPLHAPYV
jgi:hypothetical protein